MPQGGTPGRRVSYHLSTPLSGLGSENSGQNIDESLESRTSSYWVTRFRDRELELRIGESLESQSKDDRTGESQTLSSGIYARGR